MRLLLKKLLSYVPTKIPTGMTGYESWLNSIIELTGPIADPDSLKWVISNEVMRAPSGQDRVAKVVFVKTLRKYAANQLAGATVMKLKADQEAKVLAEKQKQAEVTAAPQAGTNAESKETT